MFALFGALGAIAVFVIFILISVNAKPKIDQIPTRHTIVTTTMPLPEVVQTLRGLAGQQKYRFALEDMQRQVIVLEDDVSLWSYGSFYSCFIVATPDGGTQITVGMQTKSPQWGPVPKRQHKKFTDLVTAAVHGTVS